MPYCINKLFHFFFSQLNVNLLPVLSNVVLLRINNINHLSIGFLSIIFRSYRWRNSILRSLALSSSRNIMIVFSDIKISFNKPIKKTIWRKQNQPNQTVESSNNSKERKKGDQSSKSIKSNKNIMNIKLLGN